MPKYSEYELPKSLLPHDTARKDEKTGIVVNSGPFQSQYKGLLVGSGASIQGSQFIQIDESSRKLDISGNLSVSGNINASSGVFSSITTTILRVLNKLIVPIKTEDLEVGEISINSDGYLRWRHGNNVWFALRGSVGSDRIAIGSSDYHLTSTSKLRWLSNTEQLVIGDVTSPTEKLTVDGNIEGKQIYAKPYLHGTVNSSEYTINWNLGNYHILRIANNITLNFSNADAGKEILLEVWQDDNGGWSLTFPSNVIPLNSWDTDVSPIPNSVTVFYLKSGSNGIIIDKLGPTPSGGGGGGVGGTIYPNQIAFGTDIDTIGGSNDLYWDRVNKRLGIKTSSPSAELHVVGSVKGQSIEAESSLIVPVKTSGEREKEIFISNNKLKWRISSTEHEAEVVSNKGVANGYAPLDSSAKIPIVHLPDGIEYQANKGVAGGYAPLDDNAKLPSNYLPNHASKHTAGGDDEITGELNANARVTVRVGGNNRGTRRAINFIAGSGISISATDDSLNEEVDITITNTGGGGSGGGGIGGSIGANQVAFGVDTDVIGGSDDFTYDDITKVLSVAGRITTKQLSYHSYNHGTVTNSPYNIDWSLARNHILTLGASIVLQFSNAVDGSEICLITIQDNIGGRNIIFPSNTRLRLDDYLKTLNAPANSVNVYKIKRIGSEYIADVISSNLTSISFLSGWSYVRLLTVISSQDINDVPIVFQFNTQALISSGKMRSDGADLRITLVNGQTIVPYWIEDLLNTSQTLIWFKANLVTGYNYFWMYYGNSNASDASNPSDIFIVYDDFNGATLKPFWQVLSGNGSISVGNGTVNFNYVGAENNDWWTSRPERVLLWQPSSTIVQNGFWAQVKLLDYTVNDLTHAFICCYRTDGDARFWGRYRSGGTNNFRIEHTGTANIYNYPSTTLPAWLAISYKQGQAARFYISFNGYNWEEVHSYTPSGFTGIVLGGKEWGSNNLIFSMDNFLVKPLVSNPQVIIGSEIAL